MRRLRDCEACACFGPTRAAYDGYEDERQLCPDCYHGEDAEDECDYLYRQEAHAYALHRAADGVVSPEDAENIASPWLRAFLSFDSSEFADWVNYALDRQRKSGGYA